MRRGYLFRVFAGSFLLLLIFSPAVSALPPGDWQLIWSDEFDSGSTPIAPDSSNWSYEIGYKRNKEWQYYTNNIQNAYCQDGFLHIEAHQHPPGTYPTGSETGQDGSISSASLHSRDKVEYMYGCLEMRGRIDIQWGSWPAFWSLGANGEWPDGGECDIMEYYRNMLKFNVAWWKTGDARWTPRWDGATVYVSSLPPAWPDEFHTWAMEWDPFQVRLYMDDVLYNTWDSSQDDNGDGDTSIEGFQQPHYVIVNQAIGGTAGGDASGVIYPTNYEVDWVRWYQDSSLPTYLDDDDAAITYTGTWGTWSGNPGYKSTEHYSETTGSVATFTFTGTKARYYGFKRNDLGHAEIFLDGDLVDTIDCYNSSGLYFVMLYETPQLIYDEHTLAVRVKGTKNAASSGTEIIVDAFAFLQTHTADLNLDNNVDNADVAELSRGWLDPYDFDSLLILADDWLYYHTPEAYWKLDGNASDSCNKGYDGTVFGSPVWDPNGHIDGALRFDGFDDYVKITGWRGISGTNPRTVSAWIKTLTVGDIVSWGNEADGERWLLYVNQEGAIRLSVYGGYIKGSTDVADGSWHHVAAVLPTDGTPHVSDVKLYVDGNEEETTFSEQAIFTASYYKVKIGVSADENRYFDGLIDDVRIYEFALEEAKIEQLAGMGD